MTTFIATPAAQILHVLGIDADHRIHIQVTNTGWDNATCEETGRPGAVEVEWNTRDSDGEYTLTDRTLAGDIAGSYINSLLLSEQTNPFELITVRVARAYLRFVFPALADVADRMAA
ncbi:hypothetical protein [Nocardia nova]|uniref:hypothetical protein n=1 Tax=Nocardia nova TaxID=37330 RepID=UPI0018940D4E|nr:hypothetical protein [Nocardia nova]MBF6277037.1 hypothetical protein [Nocardia nova]